MTLNFTQMNGAGNDFVMVDNRNGALALTTETISRLCDRHRGIGADGLLAVEPAKEGADYRMRYYNADGGEVEMCGTGTVACAILHPLLHGAPSPIRVLVRGGDTLTIGFTPADNNTFHDVTLTGPGDFVFEGSVTVET